LEAVTAAALFGAAAVGRIWQFVHEASYVIIFLTRTPSAPASSDNSRVIAHRPLTIERPLEILHVVIRPLRRSLDACELKSSVREVRIGSSPC
jgi:hypothetical protein